MGFKWPKINSILSILALGNCLALTACDGIERAVRDGNLLEAYKDGQNLHARWHMMMAATEGAMAFSKGLGAVHSMSHAHPVHPMRISSASEMHMKCA